MKLTDEQIEKAAKAVARLFSQKTWLCECTAQRGDDCDCGDAMLEERCDRDDDEWSREDCRAAARAALEAVMPGEPVTMEKCADCDGSGLALNMAGEPDVCPECLGDTVVPVEPGELEPDYCFDPNEWDSTHNWDTRDQVHCWGDAIPAVGDMMEVHTLIEGPTYWVARVPVSYTEDGDVDETTYEWFRSEAEARAALAEGGGDE